jgi:hypothetical protein
VPSSEDGWPRNASRLERALEALVRTLNERGIRYAIVGGIALTQHARVRTTVDIDVLLVVPQLVLPGFSAPDDARHAQFEALVRETIG